MTEKKISNIIYGSKWRNCYWFARILLNTDQFGAVGKKEKFMTSLVKEIEPMIVLDTLSEYENYKICRDYFMNKLKDFSEGKTKSSMQRKNFYDEMDKMINSLDDIAVFIFTIKYIILPINSAVKKIPNDDKKFCREYATQILKSFGKKYARKILTIWDDLGVKGCLNVEREEIITEFTKLRNTLETMNFFPRNIIEDNAILTAFVQEFERRLGQKRRNRAGGSLEDAITFLFNFYNIKAHLEPKHFQSDIEVDKWFECHDGWLIGISCKRTLRERWKQVSSADKNILKRYKIREVWHLITYDRDLSDDKIITLGQQHQIFYLNDDSERYINASNNAELKNYVRPLNNLIDDIATEQGVKFGQSL